MFKKKSTNLQLDPNKYFNINAQNIILRKTLEKIYENFDEKSKPIVVQKGTNILLFGYEYLLKAKKTGTLEIPVIEIDVKREELSEFYKVKRLSNSQIFEALDQLLQERQKKGYSRSVESLAVEIGVSRSTLYQALKIKREAPIEIKNAVEKGNISIKSGIIYLKNNNKK